MTARVTQLFPIIYVGIDVGCDMHSIAIANDSGELLKEFEIKNITTKVLKSFLICYRSIKVVNA